MEMQGGEGRWTMFLEINQHDIAVLTELVESRLAENETEEYAEGAADCHDRLTHERDALQRLLHRLHEAVWDPTC
jgi:hypothetical protein